jgi:precorrin-6B methylase 2
MNHADHVNLLRQGVPAAGGVWADLGAGSGAFTLALAELVGPEAVIYALDRERGALRQLAGAMQARFPNVTLHTVAADFTQPLALPPLDGVVMANSLHFVRRKEPVLRAATA